VAVAVAWRGMAIDVRVVVCMFVMSVRVFVHGMLAFMVVFLCVCIKQCSMVAE